MSSPSKQIAEAIYSFNILFGNRDNMTPVEVMDASIINEGFDKSEENCILKIRDCLSVVQDCYYAEIKRSTLLQEFLINELNHTEELGFELRSVKEELSITQKQRENYKKKCESQLEELEMLTASKTALVTGNSSSNASVAVESQAMILDMRLLGKFVGKKFPGYGTFYATVATFQKPYYKLVYEDGDCEDATPAEVKRLLVDASKIPKERVEAIMRKSEEFDFDNPEECFTGLIDVAPGTEEILDIYEDDDQFGLKIKSEAPKETTTNESIDSDEKSTDVDCDNVIYGRNDGGSGNTANSLSNANCQKHDSGIGKDIGSESYHITENETNDCKPIKISNTDNKSGEANGTSQFRALDAPIYKKKENAKYVPCPYCHKMYHHTGIDNHISRKCGNRSATLASSLPSDVEKCKSISSGNEINAINSPSSTPPQRIDNMKTPCESNGSPISISSGSVESVPPGTEQQAPRSLFDTSPHSEFPGNISTEEVITIKSSPSTSETSKSSAPDIEEVTTGGDNGKVEPPKRTLSTAMGSPSPETDTAPHDQEDQFITRPAKRPKGFDAL